MITLEKTKCPGCGADLLGVSVYSKLDPERWGTSQTIEVACIEGCRVTVVRERAPTYWLPLAVEVLESL